MKRPSNFFGLQIKSGIRNTYSEYPVIKKDGSEIWLGQNTQLIIEDGNVVGFQAVSRDITERRRLEKELKESEERYRELSIIDDLTQLYNSRHFYNQLQMEIDRIERHDYPLTLLLLDIDDFKVFNDTYGHIEGDQVLVRLGQVIKEMSAQGRFRLSLWRGRIHNHSAHDNKRGRRCYRGENQSGIEEREFFSDAG